MYRVLLILAVVPVLAALAARWWCVIRVVMSDGRRNCRCDLSRWLPAPGEDTSLRRAERSASEFGAELRRIAMAEWREQEPKAANARENARRFGLIMPPLAGAIAVLAVLAARIPLVGALAIAVGMTAVCAIMGLLSLPVELSAIQRTAKRAREERWFPDEYDEEAVIRCAMAHAWENALPPILRLVKPDPGAK